MKCSTCRRQTLRTARRSSCQEYEGVLQDIEETSISRMIKSMKKYNLPPRLDFVKYPLKDSESPFVMYIFEFHHKLTRQDLADIWQGVPPELTYTAEYDQSTFMHDLSPVDFFEENTLPKNVRWMTFKVKKRAKDDYFETTTTDSGDSRFQFNFELGKTKHKYNYNWPYDYFTMLEMIQVEAGVDIVMNQETIIPQVISQQTDIKSSQMQRQLAAVKSSTVDTGESESVGVCHDSTWRGISMSSFFDKKEEVLEIQLTQYGKHLLSKGEFVPVYYSFFDDDVTYDWQYTGDSQEEQNYAQDRLLLETPSLKTQYVFSGRETIVSQINNHLRNNRVDIRDKKIQQTPEKHYALSAPLGNSSHTSRAPFVMQALQGRFSNFFDINEEPSLL